MSCIIYIQINISVKSAVGHVVNDMAEGRLVQVFSAVELNRDKVICAIFEKRGYIYGK